MIALWMALLPTSGAFEPLLNDDGIPVRWKTLPVAYHVNPEHRPDNVDAADFEEALTAAMSSWEDIDGADLWFERKLDTTARDVANDNQNLVYWEPDWVWDDSILALTSTWSTASGELVGFDIRINATERLDGSDRWGQNGMDLQNALTHEVGHAIGLDHTPDFVEATMYASTEAAERRKRDLHWDDEEGARYLYGDGTAFVQPFACNTTGTSAPWGAALGLGLLALGRRRTA